MCVSVSSYFGCRKNLSAQSLSFVFVVLDIIRYIEWLKTDTQKRLCQSLEKKALSIVLNPFISAYDSTAQEFGCQNSSKINTFRQQMRILWHNAYSLEQLRHENEWPWPFLTTFQKAKKGDKSPQTN